MRGIRLAAVVCGVGTMLAGCVSVGFGVSVESGPVEEVPIARPAPRSSPIVADPTAPAEAGGLTRNRETEANIPDLLGQVYDQLPSRTVVLSTVTFAVYHQPGVAAPDGDILLLRGEITGQELMLDAARARPGQSGTPTGFDLGSGAHAVCTEAPNSGGYLIPMCVWTTATTFAQIAPLTPVNSPVTPPNRAELADLMHKLLSDLA